MHNVLMLLQGEKGLYNTDGVNLFFPDRKWSDAKVGLFTDKVVTVQKDKFSFISGNMLKTLPMTAERFFSSVEFSPVCQYYTLSLGDNDLIVVKDTQAAYHFYANTDNGVTEVFVIDDFVKDRYTRLGTVHYRRNMFNRQVIEKLKVLDVTSQLNLYYNEKCQLTDDLTMEACIRLLCSPTYHFSEIKSIKVFNNSFIEIESKERYFSECTKTYRVYTGDKELITVHDLQTGALKLTKVVSVKEVEDFCVDNHICLGYGQGVEGTNLLCQNTFKALGVSATVVAWIGYKFCMDFLKDADTVKQVETTFAELKALIKKVGKSCSGRMVQELQQLNPRPWLLHK